MHAAIAMRKKNIISFDFSDLAPQGNFININETKVEGDSERLE